MVLANIFKKKKIREPQKKEEIEELPKKEEAKLETKKKERKIPTVAYQILESPHITEKATDLVEKNQYIFKVYQRVNKTEIKKAIENLYNVDVVGVRIINIPKKKRRLARTLGWRKGYKKAIVKIKEGQKIEIMPR